MAKFSIEMETKGARQALEDFSKLDKAQQAQVLSVIALDKAQQKAEKSSKLLGKTGVDAAKSMAIQLTGVGSAYDLVSKAAEKLLNIIREINAERQKAGTDFVTQIQTEQKFKSISGGSPEKERELVEASRRVQRETGLDVQKASDLVFRLESAGRLQNLDSFIRLQQVEGVQSDPSVILDAINLIRGNLGDQEVGTVEQQINKIRTAGALNTAGGAAEIAGQARLAAVGTAALNTSDEELQAILSSLFPKLTESTGASVGSLASELNKKGFNTGEGLVAAVEKFVAKGKTERDLGNEAARAFGNIVRNLDQIRDFENQIRAAGEGTGTDADRLVVDLQRLSQAQRVALRVAQETQQVQLAQVEGFGAGAALRQAELTQAERQDINAGVRGGSRQLAKSLRTAAPAIGLEPGDVTGETASNISLATIAAGGILGPFVGAIPFIVAAVAKIGDAVDALTANSNKQLLAAERQAAAAEAAANSAGQPPLQARQPVPELTGEVPP